LKPDSINRRVRAKNGQGVGADDQIITAVGVELG